MEVDWMGKMTVYHGSYTTKVVPEIIKGVKTQRILVPDFTVRSSVSRQNAGQNGMIRQL